MNIWLDGVDVLSEEGHLLWVVVHVLNHWHSAVSDHVIGAIVLDNDCYWLCVEDV